MAGEAVKIPFIEAAAPATPAAGQVVIYSKADGLMYSKDDAGTETLMSGGAGGSGVATDPIWDAAGDLVQGTGANTAARLAIGAAGGALSVVNSAVAWNSGTAFPTAVTGDRFWRTDLGLLCYYDGTRWLTVNEYENGFQAANALATSDINVYLGPVDTTLGIYLVSFNASTFVATTNNGSHYWIVEFRRYNTTNTGAAIDSFNTSADTVTNWTRHKEAIGAVLDSTARVLVVNFTKSGSPGAMYAAAGYRYRYIVT